LGFGSPETGFFFYFKQGNLQNFDFNLALQFIWDIISQCDSLIEKEKIWEKSEPEKDLFVLVSAIQKIGQMLKPFLPDISEKILSSISIELNNNHYSFSVNSQIEKLFPKI
jgi:methionyl-tRNA synthetase